MRERLEHLAHEPDLLAEDVGRLLAAAPCRSAPPRGGTWARAGPRPRRSRRAGGRGSRLMSIDVNPNTALVTWPDAVAMSVGRAKKAR